MNNLLSKRALAAYVVSSSLLLGVTSRPATAEEACALSTLSSQHEALIKDRTRTATTDQHASELIDGVSKCTAWAPEDFKINGALFMADAWRMRGEVTVAQGGDPTAQYASARALYQFVIHNRSSSKEIISDAQAGLKKLP